MGYTSCVVHRLGESFPLEVNYLHYDFCLENIKVIAICDGFNELTIILRYSAENIEFVANFDLSLFEFAILLPLFLFIEMVLEHHRVVVSKLEHGQIVSRNLII